MRGVPKRRDRRRGSTRRSAGAARGHASKLPGQLSGGQQQRVAIARAVVLEPSLVLMDEPLSNLDAKLRLEMRTEIRRLHQSLGLTTVYVTHDQEEALSLADRLVVLRDGGVQQVGTPEELHTRPPTRHVADFMGYRNLLELEVVSSPPTGRSPSAGQRLRRCGAPRAATRRRGVSCAVRPEDLSPGRGRRTPSRGVGEVVEYQGRELAVEA